MKSPYGTTEEVYTYFKKSRQTLNRWRDELHFPKPAHFGGNERGECSYRWSEVFAWEQKQKGPNPYKAPPKQKKNGRAGSGEKHATKTPFSELSPDAFK